MVAKYNPNDIHLTRVYDASVVSVWNAWTDQEQVAKWWGPRGFTLTTHSKDLRSGGVWHYTMHGPNGVNFPNKTVYHEVETCKKLVYDHGGYDDRPPLFRVTVVFSESGGKTTVEMISTCPTAEEAARMRKLIEEAGGNTTWDRLAEYLYAKDHGRNSFVINRSFDVPIEPLFEMWTDPVHLSSWLPPVGFEMEFLRAELHKGGHCFFRMSNPAGVSFYGQIEFREITKPFRIVYVQRFCDEHERVACHPGLPVFPEAILIAVTFAPEYDRSTRIRVTSEPMGTTSVDEVASFINLRSSMSQGWSGSFSKLKMLLDAKYA
jgi:uncharacterized protein YndB with AHSA1/START domain